MNKYPVVKNVGEIPCPECGEIGMVFECFISVVDSEARIAILPHKDEPAYLYETGDINTTDSTPEDWQDKEVYCLACGEVHDMSVVAEAIRKMEE